MMSTSLRPLIPFLMILPIVFLLANTALGEEGEDAEDAWDQAAVTKLANELELTLREAQRLSATSPPQQTALQQRGRDAAQSVVRRASDMSEDYARRIRAGWSREDSEAFFRAVNEEVGHIFETAGDAVPAEGMQPLIDRLHEILDELQVWYDAT